MAKSVAKAEVHYLDAITTDVPDYVNVSTARGSEAVSADDLVIPRVDVLQSLSPQVNKRKSEYIEDAEPGVLFNTASSELYGTDLVIVPVLFRKEWVLWKDRDAGGGFRGAFHSEAEANAAKANIEDGAQCEAVETAQHFCLLIKSDNSIEEAVISMSRSKLKCSRNLNTQVRMRGGDRWATAYKLSTISVDGPKGEYYSYNVKALGWVPREIYERGEEMYESVKSGTKDISRDTPESSETEDY